MKYKYDDGGRAAAGFRRKNAGDCACRAIAIATRQNYAVVHTVLAEGCKSERNTKTKASPEHGLYVQRRWFIRYMASLGFFYTEIPRPWPVLGNGGLPSGRILVETKNHIAAVINNVLRDTCDRRGFHSERVYGYWRKRQVSSKSLRSFLDNLRNSIIIKS